MNIENEPEAHETAGDYWECLQGEVTFTCGGTLVHPRAVKSAGDKALEWKGEAIDRGTEIVLRPGDRLWIPAGVPHAHRVLNGSARLMITKIR